MRVMRAHRFRPAVSNSGWRGGSQRLKNRGASGTNGVDGASVPPCQGNPEVNKGYIKKTIGRDANQTPARGIDCDSRNYCSQSGQQP